MPFNHMCHIRQFHMKKKNLSNLQITLSTVILLEFSIKKKYYETDRVPQIYEM